MHKPSVLVLDDSSDYQRIIARILQPAGYKILSATSAEEARRLLDSRIPDVALLDWNLPGMSGVEFARQLRQDPRFKRMILILLTVNSGNKEQIQGLRESGVNLYLTKPIIAEELLGRIRGLLSKREHAS